MFKTPIVITLLTFLVACSSMKEAGVVYHDGFDFSAVKNYSLYGRNSTFTEAQSLLDTRRNAIEIAIERTMAKQNFNYIELEQTDLIVTYHVVSGSRKDYAKYNEVVRFCTFCLQATTWKTDQQYSDIRRGSLIIDLVDPKQSRSVWRSVYSLDLEDRENSAETNDRIKQAITAMLAKYPR